MSKGEGMENLSFAEWQKTMPSSITNDALWNVKAYRLALFVVDISWEDASRLADDSRTVRVSGQLYRALGSIGANIAEGYSRDFPKEKARFYEYALGSARESRHWYVTGRHILGNTLVEERLSVLTDVIRLLLAMIPNQRANMVKEDTAPYYATDDSEE